MLQVIYRRQVAQSNENRLLVGRKFILEDDMQAPVTSQSILVQYAHDQAAISKVSFYLFISFKFFKFYLTFYSCRTTS